MYTDSDEVEADFKDVDFDDNDFISVDEVDGFIAESDALINSYVGNVYITPVAKTAGEGYTFLKLLSRSLTVARVKKMLEVKSVSKGNEDANQNIVSVLLSTAQVMKILTDIKNRDTSLQGATLLSPGGGFSSYNVKNQIEPVMKKNTRQW